MQEDKRCDHTPVYPSGMVSFTYPVLDATH